MTEYNEAMRKLTIPARIKHLPVSPEGYPIPWFVVTHPETGARDIRIADAEKRFIAIKRELCWVCGEKLGRHKWFVIGPMCVINRVTSEPPCHRECAEFAAIACPFLTKPKMRRNDVDVPVGAQDAPGIAIARNPGVSCLYETNTFSIVRQSKQSGDWLIRLGPPHGLQWYAAGKPANREQVEESIRTGYPLLMDMAVKDGREAIAELTKLHDRAMKLLPAA